MTGGNYITGGANFTKGNKDQPFWVSNDGSFRQTTHWMSKTYVVLYDDHQPIGVLG